MSDVKLMPCPFCGGDNSPRRDGNMWTIRCFRMECPVRPNARWFDSRAEAIAAWNTRSESPVEKAAGEMRKALDKIASDFEMDYVVDGSTVVDDPPRMYEEAWKTARTALAAFDKAKKGN